MFMLQTETPGRSDRPATRHPQPQSLKYRKFQKQDLARGALHDGHIASLDTGLGKSIYAYSWALLKVGWTVATSAAGVKYLQPNAPVLLIVPGDLHEQMRREGWEKLRVQTHLLESQSAFENLVRGPDGLPRMDAEGRPIVPPGFFLTSFTQLTTNNVTRQQDPADHDKPRALLQQWALQEHSSNPAHLTYDPGVPAPEHFDNVTHLFTWRRAVWRDEFDLLQVDADGTLKDLDKALAWQLQQTETWGNEEAAEAQRTELHRAHATLKFLFTLTPRPRYAQLTIAQQDFVSREFLLRRFATYARNIGETMEYPQGPIPPGYIAGKPETDSRPKWRIKCVYDPALYDLCFRAFKAIGIDEAVKMKGEETYVGIGVRAMEADYRCVLTATPVKNRLPDIFRLAWWAAGGKTEAHARFPYRDDSSEREEFAKTFMVSERNLTKEAKAKAARKPYRGRFVKLTAEICNVHRLWKLLAPIVLRRRKDECGEELVRRVRKVVRVEMGTLQKAVYRYHLEAQYLDKHGQKAVGAQLQALRTVAADPTSSLLQNKGTMIVAQPCNCKPRTTKCPHCRGTGERKVTLPHRSGNVYTPKFAAVLSLIEEIIGRNEQVLIGTVFHESHDHLGGLLRDAGVPFILADGRTNPRQRGPLMQRFKNGETPVCLGGLEAIANGHNLDTVNNVIIYAYSWAYDLIKQFLDRVYRLTSRKDVNVYVVLCNGTIDRKLEALNWEKTDSVELALDGRLIGERSEEINLAELLNIAREEFDADNQSVDEAAIEREWPQLRARLAAAMRTWLPDLPELPAAASSRPPSLATQPAAPVNRIDWRTPLRELAATLRAATPVAPAHDLWADL
jgi:hypothetical protein